MSVKNASVDDDEDSDWSIPILEPTRISEISTVQEDEFLSYDPTFEPFRSKSDKNGSFIPSSDKHKVRTFQSSSDKNGPFQKSPLVKNGDKERNPIFKPFQQSNLNKNLPVLTNSDKNQDSERHLTNVEIIENDETDVEPEPEFVDPTQISISEVTSQLISENIELEQTTDSPIEEAIDDSKNTESILNENFPKSTAIIPEALTQSEEITALIVNNDNDDDLKLFSDDNSNQDSEFESNFDFDESGQNSSYGSKCRQIQNLNHLESVFPSCHNFLNQTNCHNSSSDLSMFGTCLVKSYPETRALTLSQTLTSGKLNVCLGINFFQWKWLAHLPLLKFTKLNRDLKKLCMLVISTDTFHHNFLPLVVSGKTKS